MRFFEEYKVDGMPLLIPNEDVELTQTDLDSGSAGRDEAGYMHRIRVRKRVKTWAFQYVALRLEEFQYLEDLLSKKETFTFSYPDTDGRICTCTAYCSNSSLTYSNARLKLYRNYKFTVIEC